VLTAVNGTGGQRGDVGFMFLNGKRLGNLAAMEAIPNQSIIDFRDAQAASLGSAIGGELIWNAGTRDGTGGTVKKDCKRGGLIDCYIGRFGWIGDRASLEDQVANAAFVEMNMTTNEGYNQLYGNEKVLFPLRYAHPNCGPANKKCLESGGNGKLTETDVNRMADYARWVGSSHALRSPGRHGRGHRRREGVQAREVRHVPRHRAGSTSSPKDTMVTKPYRERWRRAFRTSAPTAVPLLPRDRSADARHGIPVASRRRGQSIRDGDGVVLPQYRNYVQKIRTPALKGLQYNRFVTDSHRNTRNADPKLPACDFLLHDGRACDAIEAAFLHDGPAVKKLGTIEHLNKLSVDELKQLRAFLYSL
jgi:hypothetical protein